MNPVLSIIIPCYNHGIYIQDALDSIDMAMDKYSVEVIIVNDGSTDEYTISKLKELENDGRFVLNQENGGLSNARNNGIKLAKGKYILPLDSDNKVLKPYLNDAIDILEKDDFYEIVYGDALYFGEKSGKWIMGEYNLLKFITINYIDACAVYRKSVWEKIGGYDEKMPKIALEDWDFWLNCSFHGFRFFYLQDNCFNYRVLNNSMSRTISEKGNELLSEYIALKYKKYTDLPSLDYYYGKKLCKNNDFLVQNLSVKSIFKLLFIKVDLRLKKLKF